MTPRRVHDDDIIWITTVGRAGQPQSSPVWFHWDGETFLIMSRPDATKIGNLGHNPLVALHFNGGEPATAVVTVEGTAAVVDLDDDRRDAYVEKYGPAIDRLGTDPASYLADFSTAILVRPTRTRAFESK